MASENSIRLLESPVAEVQKQASILIGAWLENHETLCGLELGRPGEVQWAVILPNPSRSEAPFKLQRFWLGGFLDHTAHLTPDAALQAAIAEGYTKTALGTLDRLAVSEGWRLRYAKNAPTAIHQPQLAPP